MSFTPAQLRAARALLDLNRKELAALAGVSQETIKNIERGIFHPTPDTVQRLAVALTARGIEFIAIDAHARCSTGVALADRVPQRQEEGTDGRVA